MKKQTSKPKIDALDKGMTGKIDKMDNAKDMKTGIKENSKKDVKMDSAFQAKKLLGAKKK